MRWTVTGMVRSKQHPRPHIHRCARALSAMLTDHTHWLLLRKRPASARFRFLFCHLTTISFTSFENTHRLTTFCFSAPEPAGAVAPAPPTAVSAQTPATDAPVATEAKPTEAPAPTAELPAIPTTKPAPGMSATSGPLDEPDFGAEQKPEPTVAPASTATPAASAPAATATVPAEK